MSEKKLTHLDEKGAAHMVNVGDKATTHRRAVAEGSLIMSDETRRILFSGKAPKGDALAAARIAGIQAAKRTADLIHLCHPIQTSHVAIDISEQNDPSSALVRATVEVMERTGAEMEALTATTVALLTLYDMLKSIQKDMRLEGVRLREKSGGRSGDVKFP
ncbi:MAG: cyclic pyranopterin monophosphate synthase MoaC [Candidatus Sumerlaeia bacterium]|nr:cyclic pyranopterin monophosphate synthase MoaC [Candidatus Sumerlaeia bacterium]